MTQNIDLIKYADHRAKRHLEKRNRGNLKWSIFQWVIQILWMIMPCIAL